MPMPCEHHSSTEEDHSDTCECCLVPCRNDANIIADKLGVLPKYQQEESARWTSAAHLYQELVEATTPQMGSRRQSCTEIFAARRLSNASSMCKLSMRERVDSEASLSRSRGQCPLELEAVAAVHELAAGVESVSVSEMLPHTPELIFVNLTTLEGQPYCLELTQKGWRITSLRLDCMIGDFTRLDLFTAYYENLDELMETISEGYKQRLAESLAGRLRQLQSSSQESLSLGTSSESLDSIPETPASTPAVDPPFEGRPVFA